MSGDSDGCVRQIGCFLMFLIFGVPAIGAMYGGVGHVLGMVGPILVAILAAGAVLALIKLFSSFFR